ncbi:5-formyltetrahydrofolate cyclo-ligase [Fusibacter paucivorans]|uniref:5-formyltetrahydrofolate cyclo-ligase n=1 Tax=Fusibacter paucivorans TaxID=76009 RepID=A0ABS5PQ07_9FIRM|nr:5-formyltetrahydrofolate cyclo-ligase [Fusibacter paucivorans]MBS7526987.1 5-formyltetrahydrofolate cyclo-ligase [Fusibacter paucivorans]
MDKKQLRQQVITARNSLDVERRLALSKQIQQKVLSLPAFKFARAAAGFVDFRNEVYMRPILESILQANMPLMLPRISDDGKQMIFYQVNTLEHLKTSRLGIKEPDPSRCELGDPQQLSIVLTPGVAFTQDGYRLGYGGGYYDRFFQTISEDVQRVGLAFELQMLPEIPHESHDIRVHCVVTEQHIYEVSFK